MQLELVAGGCADDNVSSRLVGEVRPEWVSPGLLPKLPLEQVALSLGTELESPGSGLAESPCLPSA